MLAALATLLAYSSIPSGALEVHFLDVGQGDAIFIETPHGRQVLIDGGSNDVVLAKLSEQMPFYDRSIDMVVATHMDADHIGGLLAVLKRFEVQGVLVSDTISNTDLSDAFFALIARKKIPVVVVGQGDSFTLDDGIKLTVLSPWSELLNNANDNDTSVVMKLTYKNDSFLFTGDIEKRAEYKLAASDINISADVLKVAHHGSNTSSVQYFLNKVEPKLAVIQVGENRYGHPHKAVLERLGNVQLLRNDENGGISIYSYGNSL